MFKRLALVSGIGGLSRRIFWGLSDAMCALDSSFMGPALRAVDRFLSAIFGGYLLVTVFSPAESSAASVGNTGG
jgi:hypothetical protein